MKGKFKLKRNNKTENAANNEVDVNLTNQAQSNEISQTNTSNEVESVLDELAAIPKKQRVWEVDFLRGLMILFVVWDHFMWDVNYFGSAISYNTGLFKWLNELSISYYAGVLRKVTHDVFVTLFVFTSGVSCSFSNSNGKRAIKMLAFACLLTAVTYAISRIIGINLTIYFNVIHVIALSVLLWSIVEFFWKKCTKAWQKNIFGCVMTVVVLVALIVGSCAKYDYNLRLGKNPWEISSAGYFLIYCKNNLFATGGDFLPFFPDFGWFLIGAFLGKIIYKERKSIFSSVNAKFVSPITFCGRYSLWVYILSQILMFGLIYLLASVLGCL